MKTKILHFVFTAFCTVLLLHAHSGFAYNNLTISNPHGWSSGRGTIEEAILTIHPRGMYMEYGLYLTFSARGQNFNGGEQLEIIFDFDLPKDAILNDSWLWVGDDIIKAKILDQWTATLIYEGIVQRRKDPSILKKVNQTHYSLNIYPLLPGETRKVKISYLVPTNWSQNSVSAQIPEEFLATSGNPVNNFTIYCEKNGQWKNPRIAEYPQIEAVDAGYLGKSNYNKFVIPSDKIPTTYQIEYDSPMKDGIYVNRYDKGGEGYYQMVMLPNETLDLENLNNKTLLVIDHDIFYTNVQPDKIKSMIRNMLHKYLTDKDKFNIMYNSLSTKKISEDWISADSTSIEQAINQLNEATLSEYSNLPTLINEGINYVQNSNANILLISSSNLFANYNTANSYIEELLAAYNNLPSIAIADITNKNYTSEYIGNRYYKGSEYFFYNLAKLSGSNYLNIRNNSFDAVLSSVFQSLDGYISSFDLHTTLEQGFCYAPYLVNYSMNSTYLNKPVMVVGKYMGEFPLHVQFSGVYKSKAFSHALTVDNSRTAIVDTLAKTIWTGKYIQSMERSGQNSNDVIAEIIYQSINNRILSLYTAFLALEPSDTVQVCEDCNEPNDWEEPITTAIEKAEIDDVVDSIAIKTYPNPFTDKTTIEIQKSKEQINSDNISAAIYDISGRLIKIFDKELFTNSKTIKLTWNGNTQNGIQADAGIYFFVLKTPYTRKSVKLIKQ